jgi:hypothetical protein
MRIIILLMLVSAALQNLTAQTATKPRLVVGIMVDGLQHRHIEQLWTRFEPNGFKRLTGQGAYFSKIACNVVSAGNTPDIATIMTGTVPYYHGVTATSVLNRTSGFYESIFFDRNQAGVETDLRLSAKNLLASTWIDELVLANKGVSKSYVVALNAEDAIAMGGHASHCVLWMDDSELKWSTTGYYAGRMPWQALEMNITGSFQNYVNRAWTPLFPLNTYLAAASDKIPSNFDYKPGERRNDRSKRTWLKATPSANSLVTDLGWRLINEEGLGKDLITDAIMLQYTVRTPKEKNFSLQTVEKEDIYLRLDRELQFLMQKIESAVGYDNVLFVLYGNQMATYSPDELKEHNINAGYFNANRSMALLNSYLMALYGQEKWVLGYYGKNIYLNKAKIEEKNMNFADFQRVVSDFIVEFEGVQSASSYIQLMYVAPHPTSDLARVRNSVHKKTAGDVIITLMPGWLELDDNTNPVGESNDLISHIPLYLSGSKIPKQTLEKQFHIIDIAPTISKILQIPNTNANLGNPMEFQLK